MDGGRLLFLACEALRRELLPAKQDSGRITQLIYQGSHGDGRRDKEREKGEELKGHGSDERLLEGPSAIASLPWSPGLHTAHLMLGKRRMNWRFFKINRPSPPDIYE